MAETSATVPSASIRRRASYRAPARPVLYQSPSGGAVTFSCEPACEERPRHFLDACFLCRRPLRASRDIFMYRGDTPFCSEECRQEQIEADEARERETDSRRRRWHPRAGSPVKQAAPSADGRRIRVPSAAEAVVAS